MSLTHLSTTQRQINSIAEMFKITVSLNFKMSVVEPAVLSTHPHGIIVHHHQSKLMPFVNLVLGSHKHLNHFL